MTPSERRLRALLRRAMPHLTSAAQTVYESDYQTFAKEAAQLERLLADIRQELASAPPQTGAKE